VVDTNNNLFRNNDVNLLNASKRGLTNATF
jgi:hypothetical protein